MRGCVSAGRAAKSRSVIVARALEELRWVIYGEYIRACHAESRVFCRRVFVCGSTRPVVHTAKRCSGRGPNGQPNCRVDAFRMIPSIQPARFVTIRLAAALTGYTPGAIETKIARAIWIEGREWRRAPDGRVLIDLRAYEQWVKAGSCSSRAGLSASSTPTTDDKKGRAATPSLRTTTRQALR